MTAAAERAATLVIQVVVAGTSAAAEILEAAATLVEEATSVAVGTLAAAARGLLTVLSTRTGPVIRTARVEVCRAVSLPGPDVRHRAFGPSDARPSRVCGRAACS